jgi:hypothetical protein
MSAKDQEVYIELPCDHEGLYRRGYQDGYEAAEAAANRSWREGSTWRPGVVEPEQFVTIGGNRERVLTWRDRKERDMATLAEAHAAGLHADAPSLRCPACGPAEPPEPWDHPGHVGGDCAQCKLGYHASDLHHKGNYGVPAEPITWAVNEAHAAAIRKTYPDATVQIMTDDPDGTIKPDPTGALADMCSQLPGCRPGTDGEHSASCEAAIYRAANADPCAGGRCSNPAAHAEGAHDV